MKTTTRSFVMITLVLAAANAAWSQTEVNKTIRPFAAQGKNMRMVELGLRGSTARKAVNEFSGAIEANPGITEAKSGSPADAPEAAASDTVEIRIAQQAALAEVEDTPNAIRAAGRATLASVNGATDPRSQFIRPFYGTVLSSTTTFDWTAGTGVRANWLWIGSCQDCIDILDEDQGTSNSRTLRLPTDGRRLYVTLFSYIAGDWYWVDYQFWAPSPVRIAARLTSPTPGATLGGRQEFQWDRGNMVDQLWLRVGSCEGCKDLFDENEALYTTQAMSLPQDGRVIYVRLFSRFGGDWSYRDYEFRAAAPTRPVRVNVTNKLNRSITISVNGKVVGGVPAYETRYVEAQVASLKLSFTVDQPVLSGRTLGDTMSGVFSEVSSPSGTYNYTVWNKIGENYFFAPLITNRTNVAVEIMTNGGLRSENRCDCTAPAYSTRVASGYYQLFSNSNLRLYRSGSGYSGSYRYWGTDATPLHTLVDAESGVREFLLSTAP